MGFTDRFRRNKKSNVSSGGNVSNAEFFKNMYTGFGGANANLGQPEMNTLIQHIMKWKMAAPNDLNCDLAVLLLNARKKSSGEIRSAVAKAKSEKTAADPSMTSWFESEINKVI